jgi:hypothetical protein
MSVDKFSSTKCRVLTCRRVVGVDEMSVDELSVDGLSPHPVNTIYELANLQRGSRDTNLFLEELLNDTVCKVS